MVYILEAIPDIQEDSVVATQGATLAVMEIMDIQVKSLKNEITHFHNIEKTPIIFRKYYMNEVIQHSLYVYEKLI